MGILGGGALAANYFGMTQGIDLSGASNAAIIIQVAPLLLVIIGVLFFKEAIRLKQLIGIVISIIGFYLFYLDRLGNIVIILIIPSQIDGYYSQPCYGFFIWFARKN